MRRTKCRARRYRRSTNPRSTLDTAARGGTRDFRTSLSRNVEDTSGHVQHRYEPCAAKDSARSCHEGRGARAAPGTHCPAPSAGPSVASITSAITSLDVQSVSANVHLTKSVSVELQRSMRSPAWMALMTCLPSLKSGVIAMKTRLALIAAAVAFATSATAAERPGFYIGGDVGQSNWNLSESDANDLTDALAGTIGGLAQRDDRRYRARISATRTRPTACSSVTRSCPGWRSKRPGWISAT